MSTRQTTPRPFPLAKEECRRRHIAVGAPTSALPSQIVGMAESGGEGRFLIALYKGYSPRTRNLVRSSVPEEALVDVIAHNGKDWTGVFSRKRRSGLVKMFPKLTMYLTYMRHLRLLAEHRSCWTELKNANMRSLSQGNHVCQDEGHLCVPWRQVGHPRDASGLWIVSLC